MRKILTLTFALVVFTSASQAQILDVFACTGTSSATYSPPVTNTSELHSIDFNVDITNCPGYEDKVPGTYTFTSEAEFSCTDLYTIPQHTGTYSWADGSFTDAQWGLVTVARVNSNINITSAGTVVSGFGLSSLPGILDTTVVSTVIHPELNILSCSGSGVSQSNGTVLLTLTGVF